MKPRRPKVLAAVRPNAGLEQLYRRRLEKLVVDMHASVTYWLTQAYRAHPPELAQDASPATLLAHVARALRRRWEQRFAAAAPDLARYFAQASAKRTDAQLRAILRKSGLAVEFKLTPAANDVLQATIQENVGLIRSIPAQYLTQVEGDVLRSVQVGRDLGALSKRLRKQYAVTKRRAALIARDQNNKATATLTRVRQEGLGITEAVWLHSHGGKTPRPSHVAQDGKRYQVAQGWYDPDERVWTWPGMLINCRCTSRSILPALDDGRYGRPTNLRRAA